MGRAKEIIVKIIPSNIANEFMKQYHYSKSFVRNSSLHFGAFLDNKLHGVLSFGSSFDKKKTIGFVEGTNWNEYLELNRLAFDNYLPKNSESRCISIAIKLIKKHAPHIKWILSYADGTQCGDGTIYRAAGFKLTQIRKNTAIMKLPDGQIKTKMTYSKGKHILKTQGSARPPEGSETLEGFQLRYIYLIDKSCRLLVPEIPFEKIYAVGAGMYKGKNIDKKDIKLAGEA